MDNKELENRVFEVAKVLGIVFVVPFVLYILMWIGMIIACLLSML